MIINGLEFDCTCYACPEQYDVYKDKRQVGYVRLRYGCLTCEYPDVGCELLYMHYFDNEHLGRFKDEEREYYLGIIADKILRKIHKEDIWEFYRKHFIH